MRISHRWSAASLVIGLLATGTLLARGEPRPAVETWPYFGADKGFTRYSDAGQIGRGNVADLEIVWRRPAVDATLVSRFPDLVVQANLMATPIFLDGALYAPNGVGLVEAFDARSGRTIWQQEPFASDPQEVAGRTTRGVAFWSDGPDRRILSVRGEYLYALRVEDGSLFDDFGTDGRVHLLPAGADRYHWTSGPIVVGDVVVIAGNNNGAGDSGGIKEATPEDVRGFDARSGRLLWTFHVVPRAGEFGVDSWENDAWTYSGDLGSWCCLSADDELGYVYVPLTAPTSSGYGGHRPGDNLFSNSLVAIDAATGERVWHYQMVHHDLWEYDNLGAPILGDLTVEGRRIRAVMQANKTGYLFAFDRATGEPVWPIVERPVPQSTVPGEQTSPTQPFPSRPAPFDRQGLSVDDLIDFTPELRALALEMVQDYRLGPLYTPPSIRSDEPGGTRGTIMVPGAWGAANWHTGAFDPETGIYYAVSHTRPGVRGLIPAVDDDATMEFADHSGSFEAPPPRPEGLPLTKPPYGRITAIDMNRGEHVWMAANGDGPRDHPLLEDLDLPPLGIPGRPVPLLTSTLLFLGEGSDATIGINDDESWGKMFRAYDKATGEVLWEVELPSGTTGGPMTYVTGGKQFIVVPIGGDDHPAEWIALALP